MIKGIIAPGYNISDNCHKYTNDDSTIEKSPTVRTDAGILDADRRDGGGAVEHRMA